MKSINYSINQNFFEKQIDLFSGNKKKTTITISNTDFSKEIESEESENTKAIDWKDLVFEEKIKKIKINSSSSSKSPIVDLSHFTDKVEKISIDSPNFNFLYLNYVKEIRKIKIKNINSFFVVCFLRTDKEKDKKEKNNFSTIEIQKNLNNQEKIEKLKKDKLLSKLKEKQLPSKYFFERDVVEIGNLKLSSLKSPILITQLKSDLSEECLALKLLELFEESVFRLEEFKCTSFVLKNCYEFDKIEFKNCYIKDMEILNPEKFHENYDKMELQGIEDEKANKVKVEIGTFDQINIKNLNINSLEVYDLKKANIHTCSIVDFYSKKPKKSELDEFFAEQSIVLKGNITFSDKTLCKIRDSTIFHLGEAKNGVFEKSTLLTEEIDYGVNGEFLHSREELLDKQLIKVGPGITNEILQAEIDKCLIKNLFFMNIKNIKSFNEDNVELLTKFITQQRIFGYGSRFNSELKDLILNEMISKYPLFYEKNINKLGIPDNISSNPYKEYGFSDCFISSKRWVSSKKASPSIEYEESRFIELINSTNDNITFFGLEGVYQKTSHEGLNFTQVVTGESNLLLQRFYKKNRCTGIAIEIKEKIEKGYLKTIKNEKRLNQIKKNLGVFMFHLNDIKNKTNSSSYHFSEETINNYTEILNQLNQCDAGVEEASRSAAAFFSSDTDYLICTNLDSQIKELRKDFLNGFIEKEVVKNSRKIKNNKEKTMDFETYEVHARNNIVRVLVQERSIEFDEEIKHTAITEIETTNQKDLEDIELVNDFLVKKEILDRFDRYFTPFRWILFVVQHIRSLEGNGGEKIAAWSESIRELSPEMPKEMVEKIENEEEIKSKKAKTSLDLLNEFMNSHSNMDEDLDDYFNKEMKKIKSCLENMNNNFESKKNSSINRLLSSKKRVYQENCGIEKKYYLDIEESGNLADYSLQISSKGICAILNQKQIILENQGLFIKNS